MPNDDLDRLVSDGGVAYAYDAAMSETRTDAYGYNARNELTSATKTGGPASVPATPEYAYQYDDIGNRITSTDITTNRTYTANNLNQYSAITTSDFGLQTSSFEPQFDDDGNQTLIQTSTGVWSVQYNGENRPVLWTGGTQAAMTNIVMSFDRMGRRVEYREIQTTGASGGNTPTTTVNTHHSFVYDDYLCIQRLEAANGNAVDLTFVWDVAEPVATRPLIIDKPGVCKACVTHDGSKNVSDLISSSDMTITAHYEYAIFGAVRLSSERYSTLNPYCFSSEYRDEVVALLYYNYRHYIPLDGRWTTRDLVNEAGGFNLFAYMYNNPNWFFDSLGNCLSDSYTRNCTVYPCLGVCSKMHIAHLRLLCEDSCNANKVAFDKWFKDNNDLKWIAELPDCPCSIGTGRKSGDNIGAAGWGDLTDRFYGYHEGAALCMRSKSVNGHANQCCYDKCGKLITHGSGSGSADYAPGEFATFFEHREKDMFPADWAKRFDGGIWGGCSEAYLLRRPEKGAEKCPRNP